MDQLWALIRIYECRGLIDVYIYRALEFDLAAKLDGPKVENYVFYLYILNIWIIINISLHLYIFVCLVYEWSFCVRFSYMTILIHIF